MAVRVQLLGKSVSQVEAYAVGCFAGEPPSTKGLPAPVRKAAVHAVDYPGWKGEPSQRAGHRTTTAGKPFVHVYGLGGRREFDTFAARRWLRALAARADREGLGTVAVRLPTAGPFQGDRGAIFALAQLAAAGYRFDAMRQPDGKRKLHTVRIVPPKGDEDTYRQCAAAARHVAAGMEWTRTLADTPPNIATPTWMADQAAELAAEFGLELEVLGPQEMRELGLGGILAVGGGSAQEPRLVRLRWGVGERPVTLVGKGVTFDTGGISLKPPAAMDEMKFDKSGACTVLGIVRAAAAMKLPGRYSAYLPLAENMPGSAAYRPGDIVRCYGGKTVEITNTDAEGRMLLADALALASEEEPEVILDYATLTGACVVALGHEGAGLFTRDDELADGLLRAAGRTGERLWRLPLWPGFSKQMKGAHADLRNTGGRWGGASTAAAFLAEFVAEPRRWAHIDIAGPAYVGREQKGRFGATGYGVSLTLDWLMSRAGWL